MAPTPIRLATRLLDWHARLARHILPRRLRHQIYKTYLLRVRSRRVDIGLLLCGRQYGGSVSDFAQRYGDLLWSSTRVVDSIYTEFLTSFAGRSPTDLTDDCILSSRYGQFAKRCSELYGHYFGAASEGDISSLLREFLLHSHGATVYEPRPGRSASVAPIRVARVESSDHLQVLDGHHRIAVAAAHGATHVRAKIEKAPVRTALQAYLKDMEYLGRHHDICQPIDAPELERGGPTVRKCTDRRDKMVQFLKERDLLPPETDSYLDLAACYGWLVSEMRRLGYDAVGVEMDAAAPYLAQAAYGLPQERLVTADAVSFLESARREWDVVSCFGLFDDGEFGNGTSSPERLIRLIDDVTARVLFLDAGPGREPRLQAKVSRWSTERILDCVLAESGFDQIIDLGADAVDARYPRNLRQQHLFACVRSQVADRTD